LLIANDYNYNGVNPNFPYVLRLPLISLFDLLI